MLGVMNFLITYVYNEDPSKISVHHGCYQGTEPHSRPQGRNHFQRQHDLESQRHRLANEDLQAAKISGNLR